MKKRIIIFVIVVICLLLTIINNIYAENCEPFYRKPFIRLFYNINSEELHIESFEDNIRLSSSTSGGSNPYSIILTASAPEFTVYENIITSYGEKETCTKYKLKSFSIKKREARIIEKDTGNEYIFPIITDTDILGKLHMFFDVKNGKIEKNEMVDKEEKDSYVIDRGEYYDANILFGRINEMPLLLYSFYVPKDCSHITRNVFVPGEKEFLSGDIYNLCKEEKFVDRSIFSKEKIPKDFALCLTEQKVEGYKPEVKACIMNKNTVEFLYSTKDDVVLKEDGLGMGEEKALRGKMCENNEITTPFVVNDNLYLRNTKINLLKFAEPDALLKTCSQLRPPFTQDAIFIPLSNDGRNCVAGEVCNILVILSNKNKYWGFAEHSAFGVDFEPSFFAVKKDIFPENNGSNIFISTTDKNEYKFSVLINPTYISEISSIPIAFSGIAKDCSIKDIQYSCTNPSLDTIEVYSDKLPYGSCCDLKEEFCQRTLKELETENFVIEDVKADYLCTGYVSEEKLKDKYSKLQIVGNNIRVKDGEVKIAVKVKESPIEIKARIKTDGIGEIYVPGEDNKEKWLRITNIKFYNILVKEKINNKVLFSIKDGRFYPHYGELGNNELYLINNKIEGANMYSRYLAKTDGKYNYRVLPIKIFEKNSISIGLVPILEFFKS